MNTPIRFGLIGTSWWMDGNYLPMLKGDPRIEIVAICGRNQIRAQEMATKYSISTVFTDYREMIARSSLDAIVVGTPDDEHYTMTMTALGAGLHVICEKPLALNANDACMMYEQAEARGLRHMTFFTWRWMPHIRYMRELINEGAIGQVFHCKLSFVSGYGRNPQYQWRFDRKRANGVVGDFGPHMFDQARYLVGEITRVNAHLTANFQREAPLGGSLDPANDSAMVLLEFAGGAHGLAELSAVARVDDTVFEQQIAVHGEAGSIVADLRLDTGPKLRIARGNEPLKPLSIPERFLGGIDSSQPFVTQIIPMFIQQPIGCRLFVDNLLEGRGTVPSFYDGWKAQQVIDAAVTSSETAQWMNIPG